MSRRLYVRGHNLLEMVIACFVFLTIATGLAGLWIQLAKEMGVANSKLVGQHLAEQVMEECIGAGYTNIDSFNGPRPNIIMNEVDRGAVQQFTYQVTVSVTPMGVGAVISATEAWKVVKVRVQWHDSLGDSNIEYKTLLAKHD